MVLRGEEITTPLTVEQACDSRDSLSMALYANSFRWVLERINARIAGGDQFANVGILDIFGFENFQVRVGIEMGPSGLHQVYACGVVR